MNKLWRQFIEEVRGGKLYECHLFDPGKILHFLAEAERGDEYARHLVHAFAEWSDRDPAICFGCTNKLTLGNIALIAFISAKDLKGVGLVTALCSTCWDRGSVNDAFEKLCRALEYDLFLHCERATLH